MLPRKIEGTTMTFDGDGRKLGYPTANLRLKTDLKDGVYFGYSDLAEFRNQPSLIFIGTPTTMGSHERRVEAYLLDIPDEDHYDQTLKLNILYYHRANKTFSSIEELKEAISEDEKTARKWFAKSSSDRARP